MKLSDSLMPLFTYAQQFAHHPRGDAAEISLRLDVLIEGARDRAARAGVSEADVDDAMFAVCAWIDEALLNSGWDDADRWTQWLLQERYFDTSHAGVTFFERLEALDAARRNVLEVYLLCLHLGFRGRYGYDGGDQPLDAVRQRALEALSSSSCPPTEGEPQFLAAYPDVALHAAAVKSRRRRRAALASLTVGLPLAILLSLHLVYHVVIIRMIDSVLPRLQ
ncbi:type VI secretion system protein ImpK [Burkholderia ubonensis]|uniref:DotU family type IV/VI secretion system protein n=1 Tax=Burkholderia ubonensis TaxID=101571 RepID=UPI0007539849|nr:type VI secretion system protein ImpK [Burkholderia ubonensis]